MLPHVLFNVFLCFLILLITHASFAGFRSEFLRGHGHSLQMHQGTSLMTNQYLTLLSTSGNH